MNDHRTEDLCRPRNDLTCLSKDLGTSTDLKMWQQKSKVYRPEDVVAEVEALEPPLLAQEDDHYTASPVQALHTETIYR